MKPLVRARGVWALVLTLGMVVVSCATQVGSQRAVPSDIRPLTSTEPDAATKAKVQATYGKLPLHFELNQGQTDSQVKFLSRGRGHALFLTSNEAVLALRKPEPKAKSKEQRAKGKKEEQEKTVGIAKNPLAPVSGERARVRGPDPELTEQTVLRMKLLGANPNPQVVGLEELPGKSNYFIGNDSSKPLMILASPSLLTRYCPTPPTSLVDPQDAKALYQAVKAVLQDEFLRASLSDRSLRRAGLFSRERMARETLALYKEVAAMPLHGRSDLG